MLTLRTLICTTALAALSREAQAAHTKDGQLTAVTDDDFFRNCDLDLTEDIDQYLLPINSSNTSITSDDSILLEIHPIESLLDDSSFTGNKWLTDRFNAAVTIDFKGAINRINTIGIKSANDRQERDPRLVQIRYKGYNDTDWQQIYENGSEAYFDLAFPCRHQEVLFDLPYTIDATELEFYFHGQPDSDEDPYR